MPNPRVLLSVSLVDYSERTTTYGIFAPVFKVKVLPRDMVTVEWRERNISRTESRREMGEKRRDNAERERAAIKAGAGGQFSGGVFTAQCNACQRLPSRSMNPTPPGTWWGSAWDCSS